MKSNRPKSPYEVNGITAPTSFYMISDDPSVKYSDATTAMEDSDYYWDGVKPEHDQELHQYNIKKPPQPPAK